MYNYDYYSSDNVDVRLTLLYLFTSFN